LEYENGMRSELNEYVERARSIIDEAPQMGEANTKEMLIRRFIEVLGWDFLPSEVKLEYPVRMASRRTNVDYALMLEGTPVVFVEAKGLDTGLSEGHREQITSYLHNEEGVEWGLLTNGEKYEFFEYDGTPSGLRLGELRLRQLARRTDIVKTISKQSVKAGESEQIAEKVRARRVAVSTLKSDKDDIAEKIADLVANYVGETSASSTMEAEAKEFIDRVVGALEEKGEKLGETGQKDTVQPEPSDPSSDEGDIVLIDEDSAISSFQARTQSDAMAEAVGHLIDQHDLLDRISLPYVPGNKKAILNTETHHSNGSEMRGFREVYGGYYLDTHMSKRGKEKELKRLAGKCGLEVSFGW
jgi:predicted type IV restriction endonuclease